MWQFILILLPLLWNSAEPVRWLSNRTYDFETITHAEPVTCFFRFKNTTDAPILIDNVRTTCGCTAPDWSAAPVAPDAVGEIKIIYDARKPGYFKKKIRVYFSHHRRAELLTIEGFVEGH